MKKDIEWLKGKIKSFQEGENMFTDEFNAGVQDALEYVQELIGLLDEPEVEQSDKKTRELESYNDELIRDNNQLRNAMDKVVVEKPVIPQFVANEIERYEDMLDMLAGEYFYKTIEEIIDDGLSVWIDENQDTFARAWLDGYEVEKEKKYYVDLDTAAYVAKWNGDNQVGIYTDGISGSDEFEFHLTEKEIKDYDERYWAFAQEVKPCN